MQLHSVPFSSLNSKARLAELYWQGELPGLATPASHSLPRKRGRDSIDPNLLKALVDEMPDVFRPAWQRLSHPDARAVITGQQPSCLGGPLMVLYKAATTVALAQDLERTWGTPVIPIFWNATDDTDFDEIARVAWSSGSQEMLFAEFSAERRQVEGFVGNLPAEENERLLRTLTQSAGDLEPPRLSPKSAAASLDHGTWVACWLLEIFPHLAIFDARSRVIRSHAQGLYSRYLDQRESVGELLHQQAAKLRSQGLTPVLSAESLNSALFMTPNAVRIKTAQESNQLIEAVANHPADVSPNVVLRSLIQDLLLPTVAQVVGPSELSYLVETLPLRKLMQVPEITWIPRLSLSLFPSEAWSSLKELHVKPSQAVVNMDDLAMELNQVQAQPALKEFEGVLNRFRQGLHDMAGRPGYPTLADQAEKPTRRLRDQVEKLIRRQATEQILQQHPALTSLASFLSPRRQPQERLLAGMWLQGQWGDRLGERLELLASDHLKSLDEGQWNHYLTKL